MEAPKNRMPADREQELVLVNAAKAEVLAAREWREGGRIGQAPPTAATWDLFQRCKDFVFRRSSIWLERLRLENDDLLNQAYISFVDAIEQYKPDLGTRFLTYASWHFIKAANLLRCSATATPRAAHRHFNESTKFNKAVAELRNSGQAVSDDLIAKQLGWSAERIRCYRLRSRAMAPFSFDPSADTEFAARVCCAPDDTADPYSAVSTDEVLAALKTLPGRSAEILRLRSQGLTLQEVGERYGITREAIRQIERQAIVSLRQHFGLPLDLGKTFKRARPTLARSTKSA